MSDHQGLLSEPQRQDVSVAATTPRAAALTEAGHLQSDVAQSLRDAVKLGGSLIATWAVALIVRIVLPRHLGPAAFGAFQFADAFAGTVFVLGTLGIETYTRKEAAVRPEDTSQYFGGTLLVRVLVSALVMAAALGALWTGGQPIGVLRLVFLLGVAQVLSQINVSYSALLQCVGAVGGLSVVNVGAKVVWGAGILCVIALGGGLRTVAVTMILAEALRMGALAILAHRRAGLRYSLDMHATGTVLIASASYFVATLAQTVYSRVDISIMAFLTNEYEVGWYGAAQNIAGLSLLLSPLIGWVLLPLSSRAAARSEDELIRVCRGAMEGVLAIAMPAALLLGVGADVIVSTAFGSAFQPTVASLRLLAPSFVLTYVTIVGGSILVRLERGWALTWLMISSMLLAVALNIWLIPVGRAAFGRGGAGIGAALVQLLTESYAVGIMLWILGGRIIDRRGAVLLFKTCFTCAAVVGAHLLLSPLHAWRLVVDGLLYVILVLVLGAVDTRRWRALIRGSLGRRPPIDAEAPVAA